MLKQQNGLGVENLKKLLKMHQKFRISEQFQPTFHSELPNFININYPLLREAPEIINEDELLRSHVMDAKIQEMVKTMLKSGKKKADSFEEKLKSFQSIVILKYF